MSEQPNWPEMLATLEEHLLELERIAMDADTDDDARWKAMVELREGIPVLHAMKQSRGFVPGRVRL